MKGEFDYDIINRTCATVAGNIKLYVSFPKSGFYTPDLPGLGQEYFISIQPGFISRRFLYAR